mgnify:CR=1 FL=1
MNYTLIAVAAIFSTLFLALSFALAYAATGINESDTNTTSYWTIGENMSDHRNELTAVVLNDKIYVIGGEDKASGGGQKNTLEIYDIAQGKWVNDTEPMPIALDHTAAAVHDGKIYVVGGFLKRKVPTDKLFIYDPQINQWQEGKSLPSSIGAALNAQFIDGILYVVGGLNSSHVPVNTNYAYDPKTDTWSTKAPMPTARQHLQTAVIDGKLFALGGRILGNGVQSEDLDEATSNFNRNEMYDPQNDSWTVRQPMLTKRSGFAAAASSDGNVYVFGGEGVGKVLDSVEKYNPKLDKWTYEKPMPTGRFGLKSVSFGDRIFVLGGQLIGNSSLVPLNVNEIFHIGQDRKD